MKLGDVCLVRWIEEFYLDFSFPSTLVKGWRKMGIYKNV